MVHKELSARQQAGCAEPRVWRVLDLACGTGNTAMLYFEHPEQYAVVGVDLTPEMVEKAKERPFERLICQNVETDLPVPDSSFDVVQFLGVAEFLMEPAQTFARVRQKLREDGLLLLTSPQKISGLKERKYKIKTYQQGELEQHVERSGFRLLVSKNFPAYNLGDITVQYECTLWQKV